MTGKIQILITCFLVACGLSAGASDFGVDVGIRSDDATSNTTSTNIGSQTDYQAGVLATIDWAHSLAVRTGLMYTVREYAYSPANGPAGQADFTYADVPLGLLWKVSDYGGPFVGANFGFNVASSCPGGSCSSVAATDIGYQLGVHFKFAPQVGAELYYEAMAAVMPGIDSPKAIIANLFVAF